jgi:capsular polysaccharide biosynthesis protein
MSARLQSIRTVAGRWWPLAVAVPIGAIAGAGYAVVAPPSYAANSYVVVVPENTTEQGVAVNFAQAYGRLAGQPQVLALAAADSGHTGAELSALVHGTTSPDAPVIEIDGTGRRPADAVKAADSVARALVAFANTSSKETGVRLVPLAPAAEPEAPTTPSGKLDVAVGAAAGVLVGALGMMTRRKLVAERATGAETGEAQGSVTVPAPAAGKQAAPDKHSRAAKQPASEPQPAASGK